MAAASSAATQETVDKFEAFLVYCGIKPEYLGILGELCDRDLEALEHVQEGDLTAEGLKAPVARNVISKLQIALRVDSGATSKALPWLGTGEKHARVDDVEPPPSCPGVDQHLQEPEIDAPPGFGRGRNSGDKPGSETLGIEPLATTYTSATLGSSFGASSRQSHENSLTSNLLGRSPGALLGLSTGNSFGSTPGNSFGSSLGNSLGSTPGNSFGPAPANTFGSTPGNSFGTSVGSAFGPSPGNSFGSYPGNVFDATPGSSFGQTAGNVIDERSIDSFNRSGNVFDATPGNSFGTSEIMGLGPTPEVTPANSFSQGVAPSSAFDALGPNALSDAIGDLANPFRSRGQAAAGPASAALAAHALTADLADVPVRMPFNRRQLTRGAAHAAQHGAAQQGAVHQDESYAQHEARLVGQPFGLMEPRSQGRSPINEYSPGTQFDALSVSGQHGLGQAPGGQLCGGYPLVDLSIDRLQLGGLALQEDPLYVQLSQYVLPSTTACTAPGGFSIGEQLGSEHNSDDCSVRLTNEEDWTTVVMRKLPQCYGRDMFCDLLDSEGFQGLYDFVHLPVDFESWHLFGYAFVNMNTHADAKAIMEHFTGFGTWIHAPTSPNVCEVLWSQPHQGLDDFVKRYRNSPVMCAFVEEQYKPLILQRGVRIPFPDPTRRLRAPKMRKASQYSELRSALKGPA